MFNTFTKQQTNSAIANIRRPTVKLFQLKDFCKDDYEEGDKQFGKQVTRKLFDSVDSSQPTSTLLPPSPPTYSGSYPIHSRSQPPSPPSPGPPSRSYHEEGEKEGGSQDTFRMSVIQGSNGLSLQNNVTKDVGNVFDGYGSDFYYEEQQEHQQSRTPRQDIESSNPSSIVGRGEDGNKGMPAKKDSIDLPETNSLTPSNEPRANGSIQVRSEEDVEKKKKKRGRKKKKKEVEMSDQESTKNTTGKIMKDKMVEEVVEDVQKGEKEISTSQHECHPHGGDDGEDEMIDQTQEIDMVTREVNGKKYYPMITPDEEVENSVDKLDLNPNHWEVQINGTLRLLKISYWLKNGQSRIIKKSIWLEKRLWEQIDQVLDRLEMFKSGILLKYGQEDGTEMYTRTHELLLTLKDDGKHTTIHKKQSSVRDKKTKDKSVGNKKMKENERRKGGGGDEDEEDEESRYESEGVYFESNTIKVSGKKNTSSKNIPSRAVQKRKSEEISKVSEGEYEGNENTPLTKSPPNSSVQIQDRVAEHQNDPIVIEEYPPIELSSRLDKENLPQELNELMKKNSSITTEHHPIPSNTAPSTVGDHTGAPQKRKKRDDEEMATKTKREKVLEYMRSEAERKFNMFEEDINSSMDENVDIIEGIRDAKERLSKYMQM
jgi:hypothetical protein